MAGTFIKSAPPKRPGAYFNFQARVAEPVFPNSLGVVALVAPHSWGPVNSVTPLNSFGEFLAQYTQGGTTPPTYTAGYRCSRDCFKGEGLPGYGGAGQVLFYRIAGTGAAKATHTYQNTAVSPVAALILSAKYEGAFGNLITTTIQANTGAPTTKHDLVIYAQGLEVERYSYLKADITDLAAQINGTTPYTPATESAYVSAGSVVSGTALATVTATPLTGGDSGTTLVAQDYITAQTALEPYRFSVLAFDNLTDTSILTALKTWSIDLNTKGKRFVTVVGGSVDETMSTAIARSATFGDPGFVNVGGGTYTDAEFGTMSTAQLAPRIAGIIAARGITQEITFARLDGISIKVGSSESELINAIDGGVVGIARDSHPTAPVRLELGVTTFTNPADQARPVSIYGQLKFIRVMNDLETSLTEWAEQNVIGKMQVNDATRDYIRSQMQQRLKDRETAGVIQPGWAVTTDVNPPPTPQDTFVALVYQITFGRGLEKILNTVVVG